MSTRKMWSVVFSIVVACAMLLPLAQAGERNQQTEVTFDHPVEIPGRVLPAGSYWFVRDTNNINLVQVFSLDWKTLYAIELTHATERLKPAGGTTFTFAERGTSEPAALLKWFFPGQTIGHEFLYPKQEERELARAEQHVVVAAPMTAQDQAGF